MYQRLSLNPAERLAITYPFSFLNNAFSADECKSIIEYGKMQKLQKAKIVGSNKEEVQRKVRKSNIVFISPNADTMWIFEKMIGVCTHLNDMFYNFNLNGFSEIQFTEYSYKEKGFYDWHVDSSFGKPDETMQAIRKLSISIMLNDDFQGGDLQFDGGNRNEPFTVEKEIGKAVAFPSFIGHRVAPVTKGYRYSLVVWVYGPKFV